jgi:hypothetical protein
LFFVHGFGGNATDTWGDFFNLVGRPETKNFDSFFYHYPVHKSQVEILSQLLLDALEFVFEGKLNQELLKQGIQRKDLYKEVFICAHSLGAVIVRHALMRAVELRKPWLSAVRFLLFAPAHKGVFKPAWILIEGILGLLPGASAFTGFVFPSKEDLTRGSTFLQEMERKYNNFILQNDIAPLLTATRIVFGVQEKIVETDHFGREMTEYKVISGDHFSVCKPIRNSFLEPFNILSGAL